MDNSYCSVPQCKSIGSDRPRTSFHRFPPTKENNGKRRLQWIAKLRIGREVTDRMVVCGKHFLPTDYFPVTGWPVDGLKRRKLKRNAVPSCNLPVSTKYSDEDEDDLDLKFEKVKASKSNKLFNLDQFSNQPVSNDYSDEDEDDASSKYEKIKAKLFNLESYNQPVSNDYSDEVEDDASSKYEKVKAPKSNKLTLIDEAMTPEAKKFLSIGEISSQKSSENEEESFSNSVFEDHEEHMDTSPYVSRVHVIVPDSSPSVGNADECSPKKLIKSTMALKKFKKEGISSSVVQPSAVKVNKNSDFDYMVFQASPNDSNEILTQKLQTMISVNTLLQNKVKFYKNKCIRYEKDVNIMKGVIENLKQINSATFDN